MRHKGVNKEQTRQKVVDAASRGFRKNGYVGVEGISKLAGVTVGAFYGHLGSKGKAFDTVLSVGLDEVIEAVPHFQKAHGKAWLQAFADYYLGKVHRLDLECGCAMASLTAEVMRASADTQNLYETKMVAIATLIADGLDRGDSEAKLARAWGVLGTLTGGLNVARAVKNPKAAEQIALAVKAAATGVAGKTAGG